MTQIVNHSLREEDVMTFEGFPSVEIDKTGDRIGSTGLVKTRESSES